MAGIHNLDLIFNNLSNIMEDIEEEYDGDYSNSPLQPLINNLWNKKVQDVEKLSDIEDREIDTEIDELEIGDSTTTEVRSLYDDKMEKVSNIKNLLEQVVQNNRIVPLEKLLEKMKRRYETNTKNLAMLEKQLYNVKVGTLEGLTRDVVANGKVELDDEDTAVKYVLEQPQDEMKKLFPKGVIGGKRRSSRKYKNNKNKTNKTKNMKGKKRY